MIIHNIILGCSTYDYTGSDEEVDVEKLMDEEVDIDVIKEVGQCSPKHLNTQSLQICVDT